MIKVLHGNSGADAGTSSTNGIDVIERGRTILLIVDWDKASPLEEVVRGSFVKIFTVANQWMALKRRALGIFFYKLGWRRQEVR
jgi:guanylate kinase